MRTLSAIATLAIALTVGIATASAQPPQGRGPGGRGPGFGPGGPLPYLRELNLTDAQKEQIKALTDEARPQDATQSPMAKMADLQRQLRAAVLADSPDAGQIEQLRTAIADAEAAALSARIDLELKIAQILTPDQRKQARDLVGRRTGSRGSQH
jgi:Spy/CpxP family protein refolding chaperone